MTSFIIAGCAVALFATGAGLGIVAVFGIIERFNR